MSILKTPVRVIFGGECSSSPCLDYTSIIKLEYALQQYIPAEFHQDAIAAIEKSEKYSIDLPMDDEGFQDSYEIIVDWN